MTFNCPINSTSFGQVSVALLREAYKKGDVHPIYIIGNVADLKSQKTDIEFFNWIDKGIVSFLSQHDRKNPTFKLWHINGAMDFISDNQAIMTFHETDELTDAEANILKNNKKVIVTSNYTKDVFLSKNINAHYVPLGFDDVNFSNINRKYYNDERVVFTLNGKFEHRKRHSKIISSWIKKFGNNKKYFLQCAVYNPFINDRANNDLLLNALGYKKYFNVSFLKVMEKNSEYNDHLNSGNIVIGMSGGEGWGLPEFQSVAIGKHAVILNAHAYKDWANTKNSVLVDPSKKIDCYDGIFFGKGGNFNQGQIFDWEEDNFISACEEAVKRVQNNPLNEEGIKLQENFSYKKVYEKILKILDE